MRAEEESAHAGGEWDEAERAFLSMGKFGYDCTPDAVTFTALISAYEKGGQWLRALGAYEQARTAGAAGAVYPVGLLAGR